MIRASGGTANDDGSDAVEPTAGSDGGEPIDMVDPPIVTPGTATFDSAQVYWTGGTQTLVNAFSTVAAPQRYTLGFIGVSGYTFANHAIWFLRNNGPLFKFVADGNGPPLPTGRLCTSSQVNQTEREALCFAGP